jgi:hypothetical protein
LMMLSIDLKSCVNDGITEIKKTVRKAYFLYIIFLEKG